LSGKTTKIFKTFEEFKTVGNRARELICYSTVEEETRMKSTLLKMAFVPKPRVNPSTLPPLMSIIVDSPPNIGPHPPHLEDVRKPGYKRIGSAVFPRSSGGPPGKYHYKDIYFTSSNLSPFPSRSRPVDDQQVSKRQCIPLLDIRLA